MTEKEKILIIDDEEIVRDSCIQILAKGNYNIVTAENDLDQEVTIIEKPTPDYTSQTRSNNGLSEGRRWAVYDQNDDNPNEDGSFKPVMLHYAVNRPVGAKFGESDLAPMLRWLTRYASWLEDRARLNRYRNTFLF